MIHHLYGVYDTKAKCLVNTFMSLSDAAAERTFKGLFITPEDTVFTSNPSDFNLLKVAEIDDQKLSDVLIFGSEYSSDLIRSLRIQETERRAELDFKYSSKIDSLKGEFLGSQKLTKEKLEAALNEN